VPRRREAEQRSELHARLGLSPAHRLVDLTMMASATADGLVDVSQGDLVRRTGYTRRHVYTLRQDLVQFGLWSVRETVGKRATYQIEHVNHSSQTKHTKPRFGTEDVFQLQQNHAEVFGFPAPTVVVTGALRDRVLEALHMFGREKCRAAHVGHKLHCESWPGGGRWATFSGCYPYEEGPGCLRATWYEERIQQGQRELARLRAAEKKRRPPEKDRRPEPTKEDRAYGKAKARAILEELDRRDSSSGLAFSQVAPHVHGLGVAPCAETGPGAGSSVATAGAQSASCSTKEDEG
jgi:hypothetical protein